jgi:formyl-CoA transferase
VPYQDFPTADGAMLLAIGNDGQFQRFCEAAGSPAWWKEPRFATNVERVRHRHELVPLMNEVTRRRTTDEWVALLESRAVPCGPINDIGRAFKDPQVQARQTEVALPQKEFGQIRTVASPIKLESTPPAYRLAPPSLGEHTEEVLREVLGYASARIAELREAKVV